MLKKLIHHEFIATGRIFLPLYGAFLVMSILLRVYMEVQNAWSIQLSGWLGIIGAIPIILYVLLFIAVLAATVVMAILRFYKNLMTEEGYLMFTLPVKVHQLINSKLIVATVWSVISGLLCILSIFILVVTPDTFSTIGYWWKIIYTGAAEQGLYLTGWLAFELIVTMLIEVVGSFIMIYAAIAATNFSSNHKVLMGIGAYVAINIVLQTISSIVMTVAGVAFNQTLTEMLLDSRNYMGFLDMILWGSCGMGIVTSVLLYWGTHWVLKRKLNLN